MGLEMYPLKCNKIDIFRKQKQIMLIESNQVIEDSFFLAQHNCLFSLHFYFIPLTTPQALHYNRLFSKA